MFTINVQYVFFTLDIYKQHVNREKSETSIYGETIGLSWTMNKFPFTGILRLLSLISGGPEWQMGGRGRETEGIINFPLIFK